MKKEMKIMIALTPALFMVSIFGKSKKKMQNAHADSHTKNMVMMR